MKVTSIDGFGLKKNKIGEFVKSINKILSTLMHEPT